MIRPRRPEKKKLFRSGCSRFIAFDFIVYAILIFCTSDGYNYYPACSV